jgi:hypothetical protein
LGNVLEKLFTYVVGVVEEELTMSLKSDVQLVVTEKQRLQKHILGELEIFREKGYVKSGFGKRYRCKFSS